MKNVIKILGTLFLFLVFVSCEKEQKTDSNEKVFQGQFKIDLSDLDIDFVTLARYSSIEELEQKMPDIVSLIFKDAKKEMEQNNKISNVIVDVKFHNGTAYLNEIVFFDESQNQIITRATLNYNTMQFATVSDVSANNFDLQEILGNTSTYKKAGHFAHSNTENLDVLTGEVAGYLFKNLKKVEDCTFVKFNINQKDTQINNISC